MEKEPSTELLLQNVSRSSLSNMSSKDQEDFVANLRSTVKRLQETQCSFEASDPLEEFGETL